MKEFFRHLTAHKTRAPKKLEQAQTYIEQGLTFSEIERKFGLNLDLEQSRIKKGNLLDHERKELKALDAK